MVPEPTRLSILRLILRTHFKLFIHVTPCAFIAFGKHHFGIFAVMPVSFSLSLSFCRPWSEGGRHLDSSSVAGCGTSKRVAERLAVLRLCAIATATLSLSANVRAPPLGGRPNHAQGRPHPEDLPASRDLHSAGRDLSHKGLGQRIGATVPAALGSGSTLAVARFRIREGGECVHARLMRGCFTTCSTSIHGEQFDNNSKHNCATRSDAHFPTLVAEKP